MNDFASAVDPRCTPIGGGYNPERDNPDPTDERCHSNGYRFDPIPNDLLKQGYHYGPNGELLAPSEPHPPVVSEIVDN